ncbi:TIGR03943 family protein [Curtobacterium sp. MCBD17_040]|uniref:TIGR03943 family putative permease subunit n=1 Tax=Curtobacterium sp. MCBD17_040 TaxID=2175674 RepID=UPI000DA8E654|nr:TIGR03943 family protein [Curtobacterium sp. MCBD17_040]WIB63385.1 TIGR03943 family protein [Curtobacterium sp. MCBD17_040]
MSSSERRRVLFGLGSVLALAVATLWLGAAGHLDLYINPRYGVFTMALAAIAVVAAAAGLSAVAWQTAHPHLERGHGHGDDVTVVPDGSSGRGAALSLRVVAVAVAVVVTVGISTAMFVLPPTTLSARTAQQRSVDSGSLSTATGSGGAVALLGSGSVDTSEYGVKDWAALIRQTTDTSALVGKRLRLTGFVVPDTDGGFTLTRFVISCCAVDAQPVGVGVVTDGSVPAANQWVTVSGALAANPDAGSDVPLVIRAATVEQVQRPSDPYEY